MSCTCSGFRVLVLLHSGCSVLLFSEIFFFYSCKFLVCVSNALGPRARLTTVPLSLRDAQRLELLVIPMGSLSRPVGPSYTLTVLYFDRTRDVSALRFSALERCPLRHPQAAISGRCAEWVFRTRKWLRAELEHPWFTLNRRVVVHSI